MKNLFRKNSLFVVMIALIVFISTGLTGKDNFIEQKIKIDQYLTGIYKADQPGAAVLVVLGGKTILRKGYGLADMELNVPITPEMIFRIGSITKQFTAVAILMLVEEGKIKLDDLLTVYLPDYPLKGKKVTIRHLLNHTSGIKSYTSMPEFMKNMREDKSVKEIIDVFKDQPYDFEPGEKYLYNNSGYILLGAVIEKVSGLNYAAFINEKIFDRADMKNSFYGEAALIIKNRVKGYGRGDKGVVNSPYISMTLPYSAGALLSTIDDLYKWNRWLNSGKLISGQSLAKVYSRSKLNNGEEISYCFGFMNIDFLGFKEIHHGGGINGFITNKLYIPEKDIFVTVLSNSTGNEVSPQFISQWIAALLLGKPYSEEVGKILTEKELDEYVGVYKINADETRTVTRKGKKLFTLRTGSRKLEAFNRSFDTFFYKKSFTWFTFERDKKNGKVIAMTMHSLNGIESAKRTNKKIKVNKAVKIDKSIYREFPGKYRMQGFHMVISVDSGRLMAQATGQASIELFPLSSLKYFIKGINATIEFNRDEKGKITSLTLTQGKIKMKGDRL